MLKTLGLRSPTLHCTQNRDRTMLLFFNKTAYMRILNINVLISGEQILDTKHLLLTLVELCHCHLKE